MTEFTSLISADGKIYHKEIVITQDNLKYFKARTWRCSKCLLWMGFDCFKVAQGGKRKGKLLRHCKGCIADASRRQRERRIRDGLPVRDLITKESNN